MYPGSQYKRERNPKENASLFSKITFFYARHILKKAAKRELREDDIYEVTKDSDAGPLRDTLEFEWQKEAQKKHPSFSKVMIRTYGKSYVMYGVLQLLFKIPYFMIAPYIISKLVAYFSPGQTDISRSLAFAYAVVLLMCEVAHGFYEHNYMILIQNMGLRMRVAVSALIYRKTLRLCDSGLAKITSGKIVTLISKDAYAFEAALLFSNDVWVGVFQIVIMTALMYSKMGISAIIGIGFFVLATPAQLWLGVKTKDIRIECAQRTDERLRLIQEILTTIKIIKMYTWERFFNKSTVDLRKKEITKLKYIFYIKTALFTIANMNAKISLYICFISYIFFENNISAEKAFYVISCYSALRQVLSISVPLSIAQIAEAKSSSKRIKECLLAKEVDTVTASISSAKVSINVNADIGAIFKKKLSKQLNFNCTSGLIGITGPVGGGKSTLLKAILGEVSVPNGSITTSGSISYASQEPWIFPGTIKQNILFGQEYNADRYSTILRICALQLDLQTFPLKDETIVTDKGLNLSKGQQARINLARALYLERDVYLLDDILSALDATVTKYIFERCIKGFLKDKLCVLVTHNKRCLQQVDRMVVIDRGAITSDGPPKFQKTNDEENGQEVTEDLDKITELDSTTLNGSIGSVDEKTPLLSDPLIENSAQIYGEHHKEGKVDFEVYKVYFKHAGGWKIIPILIIFFMLAQAFSLSFDFFISKWVDIEERRNILIGNNTYNGHIEFKKLEYVHNNVSYFYTIIIGLATTFMSIASFNFFALTLRASRRLHYESFSKILTAHMTFFDSNLSGNILNRFSKDFGTIDEYMPFIMYECLRIFLILIGVTLMVVFAYYILIFPTTLLALILFFMRHYYISTGRSLKRLDGITKAPVIGHMNASIEGLATIRVNKVEHILEKQFNHHLNVNSSTSYMYIASNRAFGFFMDMLCSVYIMIIVSTFLCIETGSLAGKVGLAITQAAGLTGLLQWGIRQWAEMENHMTSVERVMEYANTPKEVNNGEEPLSWPKSGHIQFTNVSLKYCSTSDVILDHINFTIEPKQKIGIVGRTGAGKSSLISVLFRLYDVEGMIQIDGYDIKAIDLELVRSKISIIPQDPILFSGTLRTNLDPFDEFTDMEIWKALKEVQLSGQVESEPLGLQTLIQESGSNFSVGQKHLICIARAILKNNNILVLDEATANVDPETDALIQTTIRRVFVDCTVLTIAHRLNTIMNSDKVMVVDAGRIVEFDSPLELLKNTKSVFFNMTNQSSLMSNFVEEKKDQ